MPILVNAVNRFAQSSLGKKAINPFTTMSVAMLTTLSCVTKDALNCGFYVTQSLSNEKIPEDKRGFVASIDLVNGLLNVGLQFITGLWYNKQIDKFFKNTIEKSHFPKEETINKLVKTFNISEKSAEQALKNMKKLARGGVEAVGTLLLTQIFVKRVVVPYISTPLATKLNNWNENRRKNKALQAPNNSLQSQDTFQGKVDNGKVNLSGKVAKTGNIPDCFKSFIK